MYSRTENWKILYIMLLRFAHLSHILDMRNFIQNFPHFFSNRNMWHFSILVDFLETHISESLIESSRLATGYIVSISITSVDSISYHYLHTFSLVKLAPVKFWITTHTGMDSKCLLMDYRLYLRIIFFINKLNEHYASKTCRNWQINASIFRCNVI